MDADGEKLKVKPRALLQMIKTTAVTFATIVLIARPARGQCTAFEGTYAAREEGGRVPPIKSITIGHGRDGVYPFDLRMNRFVSDSGAYTVRIKGSCRGYGFPELKGAGPAVADINTHGHRLLLIMDTKNLSTPQMHPYSVYETLSYTLYDHGRTCAYTSGDLDRKTR